MKARIPRFVAEVPGIVLAPLVVVGGMAALLYLAGLVPERLQGPPGGLEEYRSIEEAESALGFPIAMPSFFPEYLSWPPAEVQGQLRPVPMARMLFLSADGGEEVFLICQVLSTSETLPVGLPWIETVQSELPMSVRGNPGVVFVGVRASGETVNGVHWSSGDFHFVVVTSASVRDLIMLAESMHT